MAELSGPDPLGVACFSRPSWGRATATQTATRRPRTARSAGGLSARFRCTQAQTAIHRISRRHEAPPILSPETRVRIPVAVPHNPHNRAGFLVVGPSLDQWVDQ
jgi:hypothetical protein